MIGVKRETLSLDEIQNNSVILKSGNGVQVKNEYLSEVNTSEFNTSLNTSIIKYEILPDVVDQDEKFPNLKNFISNLSNEEYSETDSNKKCKSSDEESLPSSNTSYVSSVENDISGLNRSDKTEIDDTYVTNNGCGEIKISLNDALEDCLMKIHDLPLENNDYLDELKKFNENEPTSKKHSNLHERKRKMSLSERYEYTSNCESENDHFCVKENKKIRKNSTNNIIQRQKPRSHQEISVDIPNVFADQSSEVEHSMKTFERFLQKGLCLSLPSTIDKCIECCVYQSKTNLTKYDYENIACRFFAFRQLQFTKLGILTVAGFPDPYINLSNADMNMWLPDMFSTSLTCNNFDIQVSMKILEDAGGQLCKFVHSENEALTLNWFDDQKNRKIAWKKCVNGVREMCDVCKTTIFNYHWVCGKCGFVVCVDCYKVKRMNYKLNSTKFKKNEYDRCMWLLCSDQEEHQIDQLTITQILAGDTLNLISKFMHNVCLSQNIHLDCDCNKLSVNVPHRSKELITDMFMNNKYFNNNSCHSSDQETSTLSTLLSKNFFDYDFSNKSSEAIENKYEDKDSSPVFSDDQDKNGIISYNGKNEVHTSTLSSWFLSEINAPPHMWLCDGRLLRLLDPKSKDNYGFFQKQWKRGLPVLVSKVGNSLNSTLWLPESFSRDFGDQKNDLINCATGKVVFNQPMSIFWDGFENAAKRLCDKQGDKMLLKLKDWPPSADFAEILPERFQDLINSLPLKEYTHRDGRLNLASYLPECFVRPDLGPKMYSAYGNVGSDLQMLGTTNLHLDISDAVNVMVFVAITKNCEQFDQNWRTQEAFEIIEEAGCDDLTKRRVYEEGEIPGALWHIYQASDADSIRDFLNKVAVERGIYLEKHHDPIHDQSHYLDAYLRERLFKEYGVKGYPIVQCYGDAVFIPAGAPHQVRNLHNCIKVAEDFVSPENVHHSFRMTQEFRNLTDGHTNHEDKLQIKNIVYHAIKESLTVFMNKYHNSP